MKGKVIAVAFTAVFISVYTLYKDHRESVRLLEQERVRVVKLEALPIMPFEYRRVLTDAQKKAAQPVERGYPVVATLLAHRSAGDTEAGIISRLEALNSRIRSPQETPAWSGRQELDLQKLKIIGSQTEYLSQKVELKLNGKYYPHVGGYSVSISSPGGDPDVFPYSFDGFRDVNEPRRMLGSGNSARQQFA